MKKVIFLMFIIFLAACNQRKNIQLVPLDYRGWEKTTDLLLNYPIPGHEDHLRIIYINKTGENLTRETRDNRLYYTFPEGTVIVKEIYPTLNPDPAVDKPGMLTVMLKDSGNPDSRGGWLWIIKDLTTDTETVRRDEFCIGCHAIANQQHPYGQGNPAKDFCDYAFFVPTQFLDSP